MSKHITRAKARPARQDAICNNASNLVRWPVWSVMTTDDLIRLLRLAGPNSVVPLALAAFAGLRTAELAARDWDNIQVDQAQIQIAVPPAPRAVPIPDNLVIWLRSSPDKNGPVVHALSLQAGMKTLSRAIAVNDLPATLHTSFAAYRGALIRDLVQVGVESGDSLLLLRLQLPAKISVTDAKRWFAITPESVPDFSLEPARSSHFWATID